MERDDRGLTLIELLITIILMAGAVVAVFAAWNGNLRASQTHRRQAELQTVMVSSSDWVTSRDTAFSSCKVFLEAEIMARYQEAAQLGLPPNWPQSSAVVSNVRFWDDTLTRPGLPARRGDWSDTLCPPTLDLMQEITLVLTHPSGSPIQTVVVVKNNG